MESISIKQVLKPNIVIFYLQSPGFALVIDRRRGSLQEVQIEFDKIITLFPAKIKEVFLLYHYGEGKNIIGVLDRSKDEL